MTTDDDSRLIAFVNQAPPGQLVRKQDGSMVAHYEKGEAQAAKEAGIAVKRSQIRTILLREGVRWCHTHSWGTVHDKVIVPKERRSSATTPSHRKARRPSAPTNSSQ